MSHDIKNIKNNEDNSIKEVKPKVYKKRGRKPKKKKPEDLLPKVPKKRGRKPKPKKPEDLLPKVPKKRGRKPKPKDPNTPPKVLKKRGRKPKKKVYSVKVLPKTFFEENKNETLILHLPIQSKDLDLSSQETELLKYNPVIGEPEPYEPNSNNNNFSLLSIKKSIESNDINCKNYAEFTNFLKNDDINKEIEENLEIDKKRKNKKVIKNDKSYALTKDKLINIRYEFINSNKNKTWPKKINLNCLWCCHKFDTVYL